MKQLTIPTIPNSPLVSVFSQQTHGQLSLRKNSTLDFVENSAFDAGLAKYDSNYQNSQAHSQNFLNHMAGVLSLLKSQFSKNSTAIEVGCGKGDFVEMIENDGHFQIIGFDATYEGSNPHIYKRYLSHGDKMEVDLVILRHVLEHVPRPHVFLAMLKDIFGFAKIYIEVPNYDWIVENQTFFDITYEHVNYFSKKSLHLLFPIEKTLAHGMGFEDQYQYILADISSFSSKFETQYNNAEAWQDLEFEAVFPHFYEKISAIDALLLTKKKAYLWGAATKGCMFLVHCANLKKVIDKVNFAIDLNPKKCGKFLPGSLVPIKEKHVFFKEACADDLLIVSNPAYFEEISAEIKNSHLKNMQIICI